MKTKKTIGFISNLIMCVFLLLPLACSKDEIPPTNVLATVTTIAANNISHNEAYSGGNVIEGGSSTITSRGVCWSTNQNPTIDENKTNNGSGLGTFSSHITGLVQNTIYYVRAYATSSAGTAYGSQVGFTTLVGNLPTVYTANITNLWYNSAVCGGQVTHSGSSEVTARGICWIIDGNGDPTLTNKDGITTDGIGLGAFTSNITGLAPITDYKVTAYATNGQGTSYGTVIPFTTVNIPCGQPFVDERDNKSYNTVQIGDQCWMAENLNIGTRKDGNITVSNDGVIEKFCYNDLESNCTTFGGLYEWSEMMKYNSQEGTQGICPDGWHIPTDEEWCTMASHVDPTVNCEVYGGWTGTNIGLSLRSTTGWNGVNGNNASGFNALPAGIRSNFGGGDIFSGLNQSTTFWTSKFEQFARFYWSLFTEYPDKITRNGWILVGNGASVRCIRDN